jgi:hypothetical protein
MAKSKAKRGGPPLFELLQGNRFRRGDVGPQPDLRVVRHEPEPGEKEIARPESPVRLAYPGEPATVQNGRHAAMQLSGDRLHLSLTPLMAAIGVFVILLLVLGAVLFGQRRGEKAGFLRAVTQSAATDEAGEVDAVETVRRQPPASHLVESLLAGDAKQKPTPPARDTDRTTRKSQPAPTLPAQAELPAGPQHGWVRDFTYIVTQEFAAGRDEDARRALEFLTTRGFPAQIVKLDGGALQLITLEGYNHKDPAQKKKADEILKKQRAVGTEYFATGGGYKLEGYYKTLKREQW